MRADLYHVSLALAIETNMSVVGFALAIEITGW